MHSLIERIQNSIIGDKRGIRTPFGTMPLVYADYTASGRSLTFIEDSIIADVLPYYANTHTETSFTGAQTTALREQARTEIRSAVNGSADDQVIFCGSGATAVINKLIDILNIRLPRELADRYKLEDAIPAEHRPVVFIGPYEHHSNELPWRESIAEVVSISLDSEGQIDQAELQQQLRVYADRPLRIGSFSAGSNVTGIKSDVAGITAMLKQHGALAFWDYAAAAPYVGIDMNAEHALDAVFISPHKFIGGPGTPGVLVVKKSVLKNSVPSLVGGGTVVYVTPEDHCFIDDFQRREEGGTPAIVESIRAGMVFKLQQEVGTQEIERREGEFVKRAIARFKECDDIEILGNPDAPRLSIMSLRFKHGSKDLHYGFVVSLLNDLFGIQVRGGCSCAGPYGHSLLGMDMPYSKAIEAQLKEGEMVLRPGWVRLNFNYFISETEFEYLLRAIELVATYGWRLLPYYHFDASSGVWRYQRERSPLASKVFEKSFALGPDESPDRDQTTVDLEGVCDRAAAELTQMQRQGEMSTLVLSDAAESLRWFLLPQEAAAELLADAA